MIDDYCWLMEFLQTSWRLSNDSHESLEIVVDSFVIKVRNRFFRDIQFVIFHGFLSIFNVVVVYSVFDEPK